MTKDEQIVRLLRETTCSHARPRACCENYECRRRATSRRMARGSLTKREQRVELARALFGVHRRFDDRQRIAAGNFY